MRQPIRGQRGLVIALAFERERLVQIIEALGFELINARAAEEAAPETHAPKIACGRVTLQCSFPPHARPAPPPDAPIPGPPDRPEDPPRRPRSRPAGFRRAVPRAGAQDLSGGSRRA